MILYSMTATFGKLENETLTLKPGMNVIAAPNEWGKSTWCAFLAAMLYGLDTRAKSTKTNLADKQRYQPWSGSPMFGRLELNWQGRDVTIERSTQGRIPLGKFRAWETENGLEIPELTAENCGEKLLGVERSVFTRTALIRFREMDVTEDEALRRRLNNLVTTGDDNPEMDRLAGEIRLLRNKIRYHKSGLLPAAQLEGERLRDALRQRELLDAQCSSLQGQLDALEDWRAALENHARCLAWEDFCTAREKLKQARETYEKTRQSYESLRDRCQNLPSREKTREILSRLHQLLLRQAELREELESRSVPEEPGELPGQFAGLSEEEALNQARTDGRKFEGLQKKRWYFLLPGLLAAVCAPALLRPCPEYATALICAGSAWMLAAAIVLLWRRNRAGKLIRFYGSGNTADWESLARHYGHQLYLHSAQAAVDREEERRGRMRMEALEESLKKMTSGREPEVFRRRLEQILETWESLDESRRRMEEARRSEEILSDLGREVPEPEIPDKLELTARETEQQLAETSARKNHLGQQLGRLRGKLEILGSRESLEMQLKIQEERIMHLEKHFLALTLAQETLTEATEELQRRFAPQIAAGARTRMGKLTGGRYDRLNLRRDFSILAGTEGEGELRSSHWRSDGTVDQLNLAVRLAVAETLIPQVPLILDDALVRFDDLRLEQAMALLKEEARHRQVILFTCHGREEKYV